MCKYVVAVGNAFDGVKLYGPFDNADEASNWADANVVEEWNIVDLTDP